MTTRNRQLAQIHIARAKLGLDEETYRAMLWTIGRVQSAAKLDHAGRAAVLDHLKARGFKPHRAHKPKGHNPQIDKIEALLAEAKRPWSYAEAMAKHMFHVDRLEWCGPSELHALISALMADAQRHGRYTGP